MRRNINHHLSAIIPKISIMTTTNRTVIVHTFVGGRTVKVPLKDDTTAEQVCVFVAKQLKISPAARLLFALKLHGKDIFLQPGFKFSEVVSNECDFRLRFKIPVLKCLLKLDVNAFNYYFHQVRHDVKNSGVPDLNYSKYEDEILGLGVADMYREMLEKQCTKGQVLKEYRKYIANKLLKKYWFFLKKRSIRRTLRQLQQTSQLDADDVKMSYLEQFQRLAPTYLCEEYHALKFGETVSPVVIRVDPFHTELPGILCREENQKEWTQLCRIDDVWCIAIGTNPTMQICANGIPVHLQLSSEANMASFISLVDGYYRLGVRWTVTYSVARDLTLPSLKRLQRMKCHGPVGAQFAAEKLKKRCNFKFGSFILRESQTHYDTYLLDVCCAEGQPPETFTIEPTVGGNGFMLAADGIRYDSVGRLIASRKAEGSRPWLNDCLPPSEYDKLDHLLVCRSPPKSRGTPNPSPEAIPRGKPYIIDIKSIILGEEIKGRYSGACSLYRGQWTDEEERAAVAVRSVAYSEDCDEFLSTATKWAQLTGNTTVRLFGISLKPCCSVLEFFPLGPLDKYLQGNRMNIAVADLLEAAASLASALWYLEDRDIVHGKIRCRKLVVASHDESSLVVKLSDPGVPTYSQYDLHWLPPECFDDAASALCSSAADIWAFGTTLWEIFSYGEQLRKPFDTEQVKKFYRNGGRLRRPVNCPSDILNIMKECWHADPERRKQRQELMRDLNQILYQASDSRRAHIYTAANPRQRQHDSASFSEVKYTPAEPSQRQTDSASVVKSPSMLSAESLSRILNPRCSDSDSTSSSESEDEESLFEEPEEPLLTASQIAKMIEDAEFERTDPLDKEEFELDRDCTVILQGRIGQGFYGEVYKAALERYGEEEETVAVKKLKLSCGGNALDDVEHECSIMKRLKHPNVVRFIGVVRDPEVRLVMEYVPMGSLISYLKMPRKEPLTTRQLLKFALDVATGMAYLGEQNIVHRDLAARNILVAAPDTVKISDFGLAQTTSSPSQYYFLQTNRVLPIRWYALESLENWRFSVRSDVWSFGVTVWEMLTGGSEPRLPGCADTDQPGLVAALKRGERLPLPDGCRPSVYARLMHPCWEVPSSKRPTFTQLCHTIRQLDETL